MLRRGRGPSCASRGFGNLKIRLIEFVKECDLAFSENVNFSVCEAGRYEYKPEKLQFLTELS